MPHLKARLLATTLLALAPIAASAETATDDTATVGELVVTAQKRSQNLQEVPIAVTALRAQDLDRRGVASIDDLQFMTPGLSVSPNAVNNSKVTLRGVGAENPVIGGDPGVALHIDGHYVQSGDFITRDFLDVERVEVLRGPQGTLYGRNAVGGAVNIITAKPTATFEGFAALELGDYGKVHGQAVVSGPLGEHLRARIAASAERRDGYIENVTTGQDLDNSRYYAVRGQLEADLGERVRVDATAFYYLDNSRSGTLVPLGAYSFTPLINTLYPAAAGLVNPTLSDPRKVSFDTVMSKRNENWGAFVDVSWDLGFATLKSMTGYSKTSLNSYNTDLDLSPLNIATQTLPLHFRQTTEELQLSGKAGSRLTWVLGGFVYDERSGYTLDVRYNYLGLIIPNGAQLTFGPNELSSQSYAVYGQAEFKVTDRIELVAGGRYTYDHKRLTEDTFAPGLGLSDPATHGPLHGGPYKRSWDQFNYKLGANWRITDAVMAYVSYSTGYKAGGFQAGGSGGASYNPETVRAWEGGVKSQFFERRLTVNISAFDYAYRDKQEYRRPPTGLTFIENAARATTRGFEVEASAAPTSALRLDASLAYLDARYDDFASVNERNPLAVGTPFACTPTPPATACPINVAGNHLTRSPAWKVYLGADYTFGLGGLGSLTARINTAWVDQQFTRPFNDEPFRIPAYWRTGARLIWTHPSDKLQVALFVDNIENRSVPGDIDTLPSFANFQPRGTLLPPRTFGARISARY